MITTTFRKLIRARIHEESYKSVIRALGGVDAYGLDTPVTALQILEYNDFEAALGVLEVACDDPSKTLLSFRADCEEHVLHIFEAKYPNDKRPRRAVEATRKFVQDEIGINELNEARVCARTASQLMTWSAEVTTAARATSRALVWISINNAAWAAGRYAAETSGWVTRGDLIWDTAWHAGWDAERRWQTEKLKEYLNKEAE